MHANNIQVGQCYEYQGRRCKVLEKKIVPNHYGRVLIAIGRSFDQTVEIESEHWDPMIFGEIGPAWESYRRERTETQQARRYARKLQQELAQIIPEKMQGHVSFNQCYQCGEIVLRGDLEELEQIAAALYSRS